MLNRVLLSSPEIAEVVGYAHPYLLKKLRLYRIPRTRRVIKDSYRRDRVIYILDRKGIHRLTQRMAKTKGDLLKDHFNLQMEKYNDEHGIYDNSFFF